MSDYVQSKIKYTFADEQLLLLALSAAHRDRDDKTQHDGNRGLAHYGTLAIGMVETHNTIVERGRTLHDLNNQTHWSKTKKGRAMACRLLGIDCFIRQSVRQQHQHPSDTVLDNALSAILGAVWLDCESQGRTTSETRCTIWEVLQTIDAVLGNPSLRASHSFSTTSEHPAPQVRIANSTFDGDLYDWFEQEFSEIPQKQVSYEDLVPEVREFQVEAESTSTPGISLAGGCSGPSGASSVQQYSLCAMSDCSPKRGPTRCISYGSNCSDAGLGLCSSELKAMNGNAAIPTVQAKRKRNQSSQDKTVSTYRSMLDFERGKLNQSSQDERTRLTRFLEYPVISKSEGRSLMSIQLLYLTIGSCTTIHDYKSQIRQARSVSPADRLSSTSRWSAAQTYGEICRLEKGEALSVLRRRYHTVNLCGDEQKSRRGYSQMIVETPRSISAAERANAGNPKFALDAKLTNELLQKIMPNTQDGSSEFEKARRKVKQLRKLARYLQVLVDSYGFGVLALLPSGPSFGELSLTDNMLLSVNEASFNDFAHSLFQEQGPLLQSLSKFIEPSLLALVTDSLEDDTVYPIECIDLSCLDGIPKGLLDLSKCPIVLEHHA